MMTLKALQTRYGISFEEKKLPAPEEARRLWTERHVAELKEAMSATIFEGFIPLAQRLRSRPDGDWLMAFALKYFFTRQRIERVQDLHKAEHKREEHDRRERRLRGEGPARGEPARSPAGGRGGSPAHRGEAGSALDQEAPGRRSRRRRGRGSPRAGEVPGGPTHAGAAGEAASVVPAGESLPHEGGDRPAGSPDTPSGGGAPAEEPGQGGKEREGAQGRASGAEAPRSARLFLSLGQNDGADEGKVRAAVAALVPDLSLLGVQVRQTHSFVEVAPEAAESAVAALNGKQVDGKTLVAERARRRRR
jgi:ATP-dependent RNA helicase DeaD